MSDTLNNELLEGGDTDCESSSRSHVADECLQCRSFGYNRSYTKLYHTGYSAPPKAVIRSSQESENSDRQDSSAIDEDSQAQQEFVSSPRLHQHNKNPSLTCFNQSYQTTPTVIIPGGYQCKSKRRRRHHLHSSGFFTNGCLPNEVNPLNKSLMDDVMTQPATQPFMDPRRVGKGQTLSEKEECDVLCILHPSSPAAYEAVKNVARTTPQHILQNEGLSFLLDDSVVENNGPTMPNDKSVGPEDQSLADTDNEDSQPSIVRSGRSMHDIALRFSSKLRDPCMGFTFGRNESRCDILLEDRWRKLPSKLSNVHFRIYLNQGGILMLEDTSSNGTFVDGTQLWGIKARTKNPHLQPDDANLQQRRMLSSGSIITFPDREPQATYRFLVTIPSRDRVINKWRHQLHRYTAYIQQMERRKEVAMQANIDGNVMVAPQMPLDPEFRCESPQSPPPDHLVRLSAGSDGGSNKFGMHWSGGEMYNVVGVLGTGTFATVYKLATKRDGELFAAKQIDKRKVLRSGGDQKVHNEIRIMQEAKHPHIVDYVGFKEMDPYLYIVMEYVEHGDLAQYTDRSTAMPEYLATTVAAQICSALRYLHKNKITHRDIKPANILIASESPDVFKLSDFGLSKMVHDETFLQTFCGTILYCAPEIYPGYQSVLSGLPQKRRRHERQKARPYEDSVDTWAFGAVLYHLLCGKAPWSGNPSDHREAMLNNIVNTPVDWDLLLQAGVHHIGIDFIQKMLVVIPQNRATDRECLAHPWISALTADQAECDEDVIMTNEEDRLEPIDEDFDEELIASQSQLNLNEAGVDDGSDESVGASILDDFRSSKRFRAASDHSELDVPSTHRQADNLAPNTGPQLFGEIGDSALISSGVFNYTAHAALDMPLEGSNDFSDAPDSAANSRIHSMAESRHVIAEEVSQHSLHYPRALPGPIYHGSAAPSLLGAEAHLNQLNMASPTSGRSMPSVDSTSPNPKTPQSREMSPLQSPTRSSKRPSQEMHTTEEQHPSKRAKSFPSPQPQPPTSPRHMNKSRASPLKDSFVVPKAPGSSRQSTRNAPVTVVQTQVPVSGIVATKTTSPLPTSPQKTKEAVTTRNQARQANQDNQQSAKSDATKDLTNQPPPPPPEPPAKSGSTSVEQSKQDPLPPPSSVSGRIYGRLTPTASSIATPEIILKHRLTYYGRDPTGTFVHPNKMDTRIPKNAIDIIFWRPGIERTKDWHKAPDEVHAIIATRTSTYIRVNGVKLEKGKDCWKYGKLRTGDVVSVFEGKEGSDKSGTDVSMKSTPPQYLRFRAEFYLGKSKALRPDTEPFVVEKETKKFAEKQLTISRESSAGLHSMSIESATTDPAATEKAAEGA